MIYIKKDWIVECLHEWEDDERWYEDTKASEAIGFVKMLLESFCKPWDDKVIDVVRCEDCDNWCDDLKHGHEHLGNVTAPCEEWSNQEDGHTRYTRPTDFCSRAEPREETGSYEVST